MRCKSAGGYFIMVANPQILDGQEVRANILALCRSTLAAEASVEAGDWIIVLLKEGFDRRSGPAKLDSSD